MAKSCAHTAPCGMDRIGEATPPRGWVPRGWTPCRRRRARVLCRGGAVDDEARARQRLEHGREREITHPVMRPGKPRAQRTRRYYRAPAHVEAGAQFAPRVGAGARIVGECKTEGGFQSGVGDCKKAINLARSSADASPPYGFMLLPGTTSSGFAMKLSSFSLSQTKSAPFIALE